VSKRHPLELKANQLRYICDPNRLGFKTTEELEPLDQVIGQDRAVRSIDFGLTIRSFGYNIYAAGVPGTGKKSLIKMFVERIAREQEVPPDIFFVNNFSEPDHPRAIKARAGLGAQFRRDMEQFIGTLKQELPKAFQSEDYEKRKAKVLEEFQRERQQAIEAVQEEARKNEMLIKGGADTQVLAVPLVNGEEMPAEAFEQLPSKVQEGIRRRQKNLSESLNAAYREIRSFQQKAQDRMHDLEKRVTLSVEGHLLADLRLKYKSNKAIIEYLKAVEEDVLAHVVEFMKEGEAPAQDPLKTVTSPPGGPTGLDRYRVNVVVDNSRQVGAPVIVEFSPSYKNLIGSLEREVRLGTLYTDYTMIRAGSALRASGGFLILDIADVLMAPFAWEALKRVLSNCEVKIEDVSEQFGFMATAGLRPQGVEVELKVIVSGNAELFHALYYYDEDFQKIFKIKADFDVFTRNDSDHVRQYARYIARICREEGLKHFDRQAVAELIEHSARMVGEKDRLTLRFSEVADLIRESNYWASKNGNRHVKREHVRRAIEEKIYRSNLLEERIQEMIDEGSIFISTDGESVGQVNGLSVYEIGNYSFGKPTRITARVSAGDKGVMNIEREVELSGAIHDKGVLILSGYLNGKYGHDEPLALNASICFEQSYGGVDGDSASSTELYAIISSLSGVPLRQSIAVTGSVDQLGRVQPVGGVNEKIEGFFQTCKAAGLSGKQGVIIPKQNVKSLMLRTEVVEAVRQRQFHIYAVSAIDEGLEVLTGIKAGVQLADGNYSPGSIHQKAHHRLKQMADRVKHQGDRKSRRRR